MKKIAIVFITLLLGACGSMSHKTDSATSQSGGSNKSGSGSMSGNSMDNASKLAADISSLQKQSIYFDFDDSTIKPEFASVLQQHAAFIKMHKNDIVTIDGNCDERGSSEYNLALGERRANAAQKNLILLGVPAAQIKTTSSGSEKPRLTCHEEKCWKENRRDDFLHKFN